MIRIGFICALFAGALLVGCSASLERTSSAAPAVEPAPVEQGALGADYSPQAVERRTESQARYASGYLYDLNERPKQAAEEYLQAGLADPSNEPLVLEIAGRLFRFKQNEKVLELLLAATSEPQASGQLFAQLGLAYALSGKKEEAIKANQTAIKKSPKLLAGYRHLAQIYFQDRKPEQGLAVLEQAAQQPDVDVQFLTELGEFYLAFNRTGANETARDKAREVFNRAVKLKPSHPLVLTKLAEGLMYLGESKLAIDLYLKLLERFPQLPGIREKLANLLLRNQDYKRAAEQLELIVRNSPTDPRAYFMLGSLAYETKDMERAVECFSKVKLLNPNFEPAYYDLAGAHLSLDHPTNALEVLDEARKKFKKNFVCEFYTALAYGRMKDYGQSVKHFVEAEVLARVTDTNRLNHVFYFQLGAAYERNKQIEEAVASFRKCLELSPDFSEALNYLGYMWAERGENLQEAREMIAKAVKSEPKNAAYLDSMGWVLYRLNQPADALPYLLKAVEYSEEPDPTLHDHLGDVYLVLNEPEKAQASWEKALSIEPNDFKESIQIKLDDLKTEGSSGDEAKTQ